MTPRRILAALLGAYVRVILHRPKDEVVSLRALPFVIVGVLLGIPACGDESTGLSPPPDVATVVFRYMAPTATDPAVVVMFPQCVQDVNVTHLHAGWREFQVFALTGMGPDRWEITFTDVPVGSEQRIRISDPNTCASNATGASTEGVSANGTLITRVVGTPGNGIEPGLAFEVTADGRITP